MNDLVTIKLTVQGMEHSIVQSLSEYELSLRKDIAEKVKKAVESFDLDGEAESLIRNMLPAMVRDFVKRELENFLQDNWDREVKPSVRTFLDNNTSVWVKKRKP